MTRPDGASSSVEVIARQLLSVRLESLYEHAASFDTAARRFGDIADRFRAVLRQVEDAWTPHHAAGLPPGIEARSAAALEVLGKLRAPEPAALLRAAGDSLAIARTRVADLRVRRAQENAAGAAPAQPGTSAYDEVARQLLDRVSADFVDVGRGLLHLAGGARTVEPPPGPAIQLAAAAFPLDDEPSAAGGGTPSVPPTATAGSGPAPLAAANGITGLGAPAAPMMPFMPGMGMGMGMNLQVSRERQVDVYGQADPQTWHEPDEGWDVLGRQPVAPPDAPPPPSAEQRALDAIDQLLRGKR